MNYEIDDNGTVWLNGGVVIPDCGHPWDTYQEWLAEGNTPTTKKEEV